MNALKPGYVPDGWTRGCALLHTQAPGWPGGIGSVSPCFTFMPFAEQKSSTVDDLTYRFEDRIEVQAWLRWWREAPK